MRIKRDLGQLQHWGAHVHPNLTIGSDLRRNHSCQGLNLQRGALGKTFIKHIAGKAARAIAALLHLGAISIVNHVFKINASPGRSPDR